MKKSANPNSDKMKAEFRHKLENYQATPSESLWDKIEISLDKEEALVYKNRFRVYSRLAAACLALLLAFAVIFVPRKWEQLQTQEAEIAAKTNLNSTQTPEGKTSVSEQNNAPETNFNSENMALNTPESSDNGLQRELKDTSSEPGKTLGIKAQKVRGNRVNSNPANLVATNIHRADPKSKFALENPGSENALIAASRPAKQLPPATAEPVSASRTSVEEVTLAAASPEETASETLKESPENPVPGTVEVASSAILADSGIQPGNEENSRVAAKKAMKTGNFLGHFSSRKVISPAVISDLTQTRTGSFSGQNPSVSEVARTQINGAFSGEKENEIPAVSLARALEPLNTQNSSEVVIEETEAKKAKDGQAKSGRWMVSGSYAGLSFNSGIRLAGRSFETQPIGVGSDNSYNQAISNYKTAIREYNHETSAAYSEKAGLLVSFKVAKNWLLQTGFGYLKNREQTNSSYVFGKKPGYGYPVPQGLSADASSQTTLETVLSNNFDPNDSQVMPASEYTTQYSYQYYSLPLNVRFQTSQPGIYYFAGAGGSVNFLDKTTVEIVNDAAAASNVARILKTESNAPQPDVYRNSLLSVQVETGLGYRFASHWSVELAATGNHFLKPLLKDEQLAGTKQQNARSFGASLNLGYTF